MALGSDMTLWDVCTVRSVRVIVMLKIQRQQEIANTSTSACLQSFVSNGFEEPIALWEKRLTTR